MTAAKKSEQQLMAGTIQGPLHGVPVGLKDLIYTKGKRTTMGSEIYKDFIPSFDAAVVEKLERAGAIIIGKLNTHQFAYGPTGDRSHFGPARNPHNINRITGGSSGGSGAAVSAGLCYGALGTDTGGSIRIPASCCGIVGMKPTFGRISKYGVFPLSWTLDHVGPMTRTVRDNAIMLNVLAGYDERDPYSAQCEDEDFTRLLQQSIKGSVIGIPRNFYFEGIDWEVETRVREAVSVFQGLGAEIHEVDIERIYDASQAHLVTLRSEAYSIHKERLKSYPNQWDEQVKERLLSGENTKAHEYVQAQQEKWQSIQAFNRVLDKVDVLLAPTLPILPTEVFQAEVEINGTTQPIRFTINRLTGPTNLNGFPSLSIPCGFSSTGLPISFQLIGKRWSESTLYQFGYSFEAASQIPTLKFNID
jgi:aspartyl-tRNA(Asn)/glutamyl-tRNA(Gln) amidotransferase subunit A